MPNRLASQTSPYLQQHAGNPVDWHPWDEEALALARDTDRPILLSVGYSACHWCHVMAHECFEDADTAALMNQHFVNIKVDREERPDLDQIYQAAHQIVARRGGGWPLTMFLTPQGKPFFGGTYFPKRSRHGLPGFDTVLQRVAETWQAQRAQLEAQAERITRQLAEALAPAARARGNADGDADGDGHSARIASDDVDANADASADAGHDGLERLAAQAGPELRNALMSAFDARDGGFGRAPKFPHPASLSALLRDALAHHDHAARDAALFTLRRMAEGGLYDHLGGGFCRYSTDARWMIPHFEKMLYDNGPLLGLYAHAWQLTGEPLFARVCEQTAGWVVREMQSPEGGYFSSLDADSEGEEGRFYVWDRDEVAHLLGDDASGASGSFESPESPEGFERSEGSGTFAAFARCYGLDGSPNFEGRAWHLYRARSPASVAAGLGLDEAACAALLERGRATLFAARESRVRPGRDDKILTSWNALMIEGMARAARILAQPAWADSARRALDFVRRALWRDGRLLATCKDGCSHLNAYLDDHAFLLGATIEVMQAGVVRADDVRFACALADVLLARFEDARDGGFFFTSDDHESLVLRPKSGHDGSTPSGNGAAALHLQRLGYLLGEPRYLTAVRRALARFADEVRQMPQGFATLIDAMAEHAEPPTLVTLTGPQPALAAWHAAFDRHWRPGTLVLRLPDDTSGLPAMLLKPRAEVAQAWICRGTQCLPPIASLDQALDALGG